MKKAAESGIDPRFAPVAAAFAGDPDVSAGKMMSSYGLKVNGKIFAMFGKQGFVVKLPKNRVEELTGAGSGKRFDPGHGRVMKEWIAIDDNGADWIQIAREAHDFVSRLSALTANPRATMRQLG